MRLLALSSSVLSNHCADAVIAGLRLSQSTYLASEAMRSLLIGLRLYAIADDPICPDSKGSSTSLRCDKSLMSFENLVALCAMPHSTLTTL